MSFYISKLVITGPSVESAQLKFKPGFNMIDGPSNTGKSYVHQCLNFLMGGGDVPEDIDEAIGYTEAFMELVDDSGQYHCFRRALAGGDFEVAKTSFDNFNNVEHQIYKWKHNKNKENTISWYLLNLSGFGKTEIKRNKNNKKRTLSFRDIARLTIINEESIITKKSPLATNQKVSTEEFSLFSFLITGLDAKHLIEREEPEIRKGKLRAQIDLLDSLLKTQIQPAPQQSVPAPDDELLLQIQNEIKSLLADIERDASERLYLETQRKQLWEQLQKVESEQILEEEIFKRFVLLSDQYEKDLNRLAFLAEGNELLSYLKTIKCPLCGRTEEHSHAEPVEEEVDIPAVTGAFEAERNKILIKNQDLAQTMSGLNASIEQKVTFNAQLRDKVIEIDARITTVIEPTIAFQKDRLQQLITRQSEMAVMASSNKSFGLQEKRDNLVLQLNQKDSVEPDTELSTIAL